MPVLINAFTHPSCAPTLVWYMSLFKLSSSNQYSACNSVFDRFNDWSLPPLNSLLTLLITWFGIRLTTIHCYHVTQESIYASLLSIMTMTMPCMNRMSPTAMTNSVSNVYVKGYPTRQWGNSVSSPKNYSRRQLPFVWWIMILYYAHKAESFPNYFWVM